MKPDRWQKVKELYEAALMRPPDKRQSFLDEKCDGDEELRREVESLLSFSNDAGSFLEKPAVGEVAEIIVSKNEKLGKGQHLGHYEIISEIGEGGMGEVYLAKDINLNRKVALKLLAVHITEDKSRVTRFRQEAFATSALNHPNIVTIFEIGKWQDRDFIVTEFIEGVTLRTRLSKKKPTIGESLDIALQVASALSAAHGAGIVHRDIKPENIMIREDGLVKVLDFGIAKYRPTEKGQKALIETEIGEIIGTAAYMSPEQARGLEIGSQTDIWSLGVILYEMLAGKLPFQGQTKSDRIAAILEHEPMPLTKTGGKIPTQLQQIVDRALAKDKKQRYANIAEMAEDLYLLRETTGDKHPSLLILPVRKPATAYRAYLLAAVSLLILLTGTIGLWFYFSNSVKTTVSERKSLAVLPLKPINQANRDELYEIGIADSLIQRLSVIKGFVVRPLSAIRKYADIEQDPIAAGREQKADYVLASNYQIAGGKVRVTAQLFNVETGQIEETYKSEKDADDVFAMQDAVADEVGKLLQSHFAFTSGTPAAARGTENEEAYRLYIQGMHFFDRRNGAKAVEALEQAVRLDPNYARAWAGVAHAHRTVGSTTADADIHEGYRKSIEAINRALELDPNLSEAYSAQCDWKMYYEYDYEGAEAACKRAIELKPDSAVAHNVYARLLMIGRIDEAIAEIKTAIELDPTSYYHQIVYMVCLTYSRRYEEATRQLETLAAMNPSTAVFNFWLVGSLTMQGNRAEAFERLMRFQKTAGFDEETIRHFKTAYQTAGWQGVLREQAKRLDKDYLPTNKHIFGAFIYAQLGDNDKAFEYLEKAYERRLTLIVYIKVDPHFDLVRNDPRFEEFARRLKLK